MNYITTDRVNNKEIKSYGISKRAYLALFHLGLNPEQASVRQTSVIDDEVVYKEYWIDEDVAYFALKRLLDMEFNSIESVREQSRLVRELQEIVDFTANN